MEQGADMPKCHFLSFKAQQQGTLFLSKKKKTAKTQVFSLTSLNLLPMRGGFSTHFQQQLSQPKTLKTFEIVIS